MWNWLIFLALIYGINVQDNFYQGSKIGSNILQVI